MPGDDHHLVGVPRPFLNRQHVHHLDPIRRARPGEAIRDRLDGQAPATALGNLLELRRAPAPRRADPALGIGRRRQRMARAETHQLLDRRLQPRRIGRTRLRAGGRREGGSGGKQDQFFHGAKPYRLFDDCKATPAHVRDTDPCPRVFHAGYKPDIPPQHCRPGHAPVSGTTQPPSAPLILPEPRPPAPSRGFFLGRASRLTFPRKRESPSPSDLRQRLRTSCSYQKRRQNPPLQGEGDHEVVEGYHPTESATPLRLAYRQPSLLLGRTVRKRPFVAAPGPIYDFC